MSRKIKERIHNFLVSRDLTALCRFYNTCPLVQANHATCIGGGGLYCGKWREQVKK